MANSSLAAKSSPLSPGISARLGPLHPPLAPRCPAANHDGANTNHRQKPVSQGMQVFPRNKYNNLEPPLSSPASALITNKHLRHTPPPSASQRSYSGSRLLPTRLCRSDSAFAAAQHAASTLHPRCTHAASDVTPPPCPASGRINTQRPAFVRTSISARSDHSSLGFLREIPLRHLERLSHSK